MFKKRKLKSKPEQFPVNYCPYCNAPMTRGFLHGGKLLWSKKKGLFIWDADIILADSIIPYDDPSWLCESCKKIIVDVPPQ